MGAGELMTELAFLGAAGAGAYTIGGRGGRVIKVTNLDDSGPGSFREAVKAAGPRIVEFEVSGYIRLEKRLTIDNPFITIDGSTAPGGGVCIRDHMMRIKTDQVIIRYMRFRLGTQVPNPSPDSNIWSNIRIVSGKDMIFDHCSFCWAMDTSVSCWYSDDPHGDQTSTGIQRVTFQWCIFAEPLYNALEGMYKAGVNLAISGGCTDISIHHNLFVGARYRNPQLRCRRSDVINNVIYDCQRQISVGHHPPYNDTPHEVNIIGNLQLDHPDRPNRSAMVIIAPGSTNPAPEQPDHKIYVADNKGNFYDDVSWFITGHDRGEDDYPADSRFQVGKAHFLLGEPIQIQSPYEALTDILLHVGCSKPGRDETDQRIISSVVNKTGKRMISDPKEVGGYLSLDNVETVPEWPAPDEPPLPPPPDDLDLEDRVLQLEEDLAAALLKLDRLETTLNWIATEFLKRI
jgi:pectate lyase